MIDYSLGRIAEVTGGRLIGDPDVVINGIELDSRKVNNENLFVPIKGERVDGHGFVKGLFENGLKASFWQADHLEYPEGNLIIVDDVVAAISKLARNYRDDINAKIIGVTGSSGKTSTKDMIASVLSVRYKTHKTMGNQNNEIGVPLTLLSMDRDDQFGVVEMGISDLNEMEPLVEIVHPDYTVITNISPAHILKFKTIDTIVEQKCQINCQLGNGICFYANEAYGLKKHISSQNLTNKPVSYGFDEDADIRITSSRFGEEGMEFTVNVYGGLFKLPILGRHQIINACCAIAIARMLGYNAEDIQKGLDEVKLTPHRLQLRIIKDSTIIDDTYNSNPGSLTAALELLSEYDESFEKTAVLGDMLELGDESDKLHSSIADKVDFRNFKNTFLFGEEMKNLHDHLDEMGIENRYYYDRDELVKDLKQIMKDNSIILFKASNGLRFYDLIDQLED